MGWIIALVVVTGLAILPVGIRTVYDQKGPLVLLLIGPVKRILYPKEKVRKKAEKKAVSKEISKSSKKNPANENKGGSIQQFRPLLQTALDFLQDFKRKLRINNLEMKLILAGDDPCDLALNYGRAWTALGNLLPILECVFVIKKRNLEVECDFTSESSVIFARADITIAVYKLVWLVLRYGFKALRQYNEIMNKRKGGAGV